RREGVIKEGPQQIDLDLHFGEIGATRWLFGQRLVEVFVTRRRQMRDGLLRRRLAYAERDRRVHKLEIWQDCPHHNVKALTVSAQRRIRLDDYSLGVNRR